MFYSARFVVNANSTTAPKQSSNEQKTTWVDVQVKRFVTMTIATATYKQNNQNEPSTVATTVVRVVVKQIVEH